MGARPLRDQGSFVAGVLAGQGGLLDAGAPQKPRLLVGRYHDVSMRAGNGPDDVKLSCLFSRGVGRAEIEIKLLDLNWTSTTSTVHVCMDGRHAQRILYIKNLCVAVGGLRMGGEVKHIAVHAKRCVKKTGVSIPR